MQDLYITIIPRVFCFLRHVFFSYETSVIDKTTFKNKKQDAFMKRIETSLSEDEHTAWKNFCLDAGKTSSSLLREFIKKSIAHIKIDRINYGLSVITSIKSHVP